MSERDRWINDCAWRLCLHILPDVLGRDELEPDGYLLEDYGMDALDALEIGDAISQQWEGISINADALGFQQPQPNGNVVLSIRDLAEAISDAIAEDAASFIRKFDARRAARLAASATI